MEKKRKLMEWQRHIIHCHTLKKMMRMTRLVLLLFLLGIGQVIALDVEAQSNKLTLSFETVQLEKVLAEVESRSEYFFLYNKDLIDVDQKIKINVKEGEINDVLDQLFESTKIQYEIRGRQIILSNKNGFAKNVSQQKKDINGSVKESSGQPLPGVSIIIAGTTQGTVTNSEGKYSLSNIPNGATLQFSFVGMLTQRVLVGDQTTIDIIMHADAVGIEEVVAIGYGTMRKSDLTGAVTSISANKLENKLNTNIVKTLQGTVAGLRITQTNFTPGSSQEIRIRGENSLSASNTPLVILDGMPYNGNLNDLNPADVESVSILKDASSSAIYGARAANGVILVTTKMGKSGKLRINYNATLGVASVANPQKMLDGEGYVKFIQHLKEWEGGPANQDPLDWMMANEIPQYQAGTETNWLDQVLRNAFQQEHLLSVSGGTDKTTHYTSLSYLDQQGIVVNSGYKRATLRTNIRHKFNDWLAVGSNMQVSRSDYGSNGAVPNVGLAMIQSPYGKLKEDDGEYAFYPQFPETYFNSPLANDNATLDDIRDQVVIKLYGELSPKFIPGFMYRINYGTNIQQNNEGTYYPTTSLTGSTVGGSANINNSNSTHWTLENILQYDLKKGAHYFNVVGLYSREKSVDKENELIGRGFVNDDNLYHYIQSAETKDVSSKLTEFNLVSYMGRLNYNYDNRYFITVTARRDGYSGFGSENKYGVFPSVALGWTLTNENFAQNLNTINFLKFRLSYGVNGNMAVDPYKTLDIFTEANTLFGDNTSVINGLKIESVGNPELKWEGTETYNLGVDFGIIRNRISGTFNLYHSNSKDLLMTRQVPIMNGYTSILYNIGKTQNRGVELTINTLNIEGSELQWNSSITFSLNRDKITELRGDGKDDIANNWYIGEPLRVIFGYKLQEDFLWQLGDEQAIEDYAPGSTLSSHLGKPKVVDTNNDGVISSDDRIILASQLPSWIGGLNNELSYKNWKFSVFINTVQGLKKENGWYNPQSFLTQKTMNYLDVPYWTPENPTNEFWSAGRVNDSYYPTAEGVNLKNASFVRIQDIMLSYEPKRLSQRLGIDRLRLSISVNNPYTFTSWLGWDPEAAGSVGQGWTPYPSARTFRFGINIEL